jgi:peptide/nickel transport system ATP-binding protein
MSDGERKDRVTALMRVVGLDPRYANRYPHAFSGGQRQRIGIARALAINPSIIVADEAVSALDVSIQAQIINLMQDLQQEFGLSYLFITHDLGVVYHISDRVAVMYVGKLVEIGGKKQLFSHPRHPYTEALLSAVPQPDPRIMLDRIITPGSVADPANRPAGCCFHPRCRYAKRICTEEEPRLANLAEAGEDEHLSACHFSEKLALRGIRGPG